jgi:cytochrome c biogenesis protein CcmG, thiol:disulfide interchange protein DsbE
VKSLRIVIPVFLAAVLAGCVGCNDQPKLHLIGSQAPDFTLQDSERTVSLHDYRGKIVILNLWATWCPPCIGEIPDLELLQKRMGDKVTIVAVSYDDTDNAYTQFVREHKLGFLTVHDRERKLKDLYQPTGPPETYVIDRSGKVLRKFIGAQQWAGPEIVDYLQKL